MKENNTFVALCTESFTFNHAAICSVAMVKVINSVIVQEFNSLIRPVAGKGNMLDTFLSVFGGSKYANAPEFPEVLRLMEIFTDNSKVVVYDEKVIVRLRKNCRFFGVESTSFFTNEFFCISRMPGEELEESCECYKIKLKADCSLLDKARACAGLYMKVGQAHRLSSNELCDAWELFSMGKEDLYNLLPDHEITNRNTIFYHKHIFISGIFSRYPDINVLLSKLHKFGAINLFSFSYTADMVVLGKGADRSVWEKLRQDNNIQILTEIALYDILDDIEGR